MRGALHRMVRCQHRVQSTITTQHLNRVLDEAELNGWIVKSLRPTLLNKGVKTQSRGSFSVEEYRVIYTALRGYHKQTTNEKSALHEKR